jgi:L-threonylcarbamoyladenylate synthase
VSPPLLGQSDALRLGECVADGGIAVFPTDTVYGIGCDPRSRTAVERLYEIKGRHRRRPAAVMFFSLEPALMALPGLLASERAAIAALLPGPVTLLLTNRDRRFPLASAPDPDTVGLRVPQLPQALEALASLNVPLMQSSANFTGAGDVRRLADLPRDLLEQADLVLDGGELAGTASTVIDLRSFEQDRSWRVVREGALEISAVEERLLLAS